MAVCQAIQKMFIFKKKLGAINWSECEMQWNQMHLKGLFHDLSLGELVYRGVQ